MTTKEFDYSKLAAEVSKLHTAFRDRGFDSASAMVLTQTCLRTFPMFQKLVEEVKPIVKSIGYIEFTDGSREKLYDMSVIDQDKTTYTGEHSKYRVLTYVVADPLSILAGSRLEYKYQRFDYKYNRWEYIDNVKEICLVKEA